MKAYFAEFHAKPDWELGGGPDLPEDTPEVASLRHSESYEDRIRLGNALCWQLRSRQAAEAYTSAIELDPRRLEGYRKRAGRYICTLRPESAMEDLGRCMDLGGDAMDLTYRMGLCHYYLGQYPQAMEQMEACYPLCDDEMGIAAIFWHTLSAWRCGRQPVLLEEHYRPGMQVGHHTGYDLVMGVAAGQRDLAELDRAIQTEPRDLEYSILAYGRIAMLMLRGQQEQAQALRYQLLRRDGFWISYAYIAAWNDAYRGGRGNLR